MSANMKFMDSFTGMRLEERIIDEVLIDKENLQTGDILIGRKFVGYSTEQMVLSGGYASQVAMIVRDGSELIVLEA
mgnify:CR=1 FL=1